MYLKRNKELELLALYREDYKTRFYLRQISVLSKLPLKTVQTILYRLEKQHILKTTLEGKNKYFSLNLDNIHTKFFLLQTEIYKTTLFLEAYPVFKTFLKSFSTSVPFLGFGCFASFKAGKYSDVDFLLLSKKNQKLPFHLLSYKPHLITLSASSFTKALYAQETLIKEIMDHHIILNNHSFYVNIMWDYYGT